MSPGPGQEDQLLWRPGAVLESRVAEYLVEASLRTGGEKAADRGSVGALTRDNEQVGSPPSARWPVSHFLHGFTLLLLLDISFSGRFLKLGKYWFRKSPETLRYVFSSGLFFSVHTLL